MSSIMMVWSQCAVRLIRGSERADNRVIASGIKTVVSLSAVMFTRCGCLTQLRHPWHLVRARKCSRQERS